MDGIALPQPARAEAIAADRALRIARHMQSQEGIGSIFPIDIESAGEGEAQLSMRIAPTMTNGFGVAHGGAIFTLADTAFAYACNSRNLRTVAQGCSILFLAPARLGEKLTAKAQELGAQGRSASFIIHVSGEDGRLVATMQGHSRSIGGFILEEE